MRSAALLFLAGCAAVPPAEVLELRVPESVDVGDEVRVSARVRARGSVRLHAAREGHVPGGPSREFDVDGEESLEWSFVPREPGTYAVVIGSGGAGRVALLEARPPRLKVLYVEHLPRYEYRFLKNALIRDPSLRVHCLLTSADPEWPQEHTPGFDDPPLRFPSDLAGYDVVVMGDAAPEGRLVRFVREEGKGLVVISGRARWTGELEGLLPVSIEGETREGADFAPRATERGREFFPFEFSAELRSLRWLWTAKPRAGAAVLAEAGAHPLFVAWTAGKGRVFWSATDETWLWRYLTGDAPVFYPLWRRAIEWAARGK